MQLWDHMPEVLQPFSSGWNGTSSISNKGQVKIPMTKVKAEASFAADDYYSTVFELIINSDKVNSGDLTGTELEKAETELFRRAIAESVRFNMWLGDVDGGISEFTSFDGFLKQILEMCDTDETSLIHEEQGAEIEENASIEMLKAAWKGASSELQALRSEGQLVYYVSSDVYNDYEFYLDSTANANAYVDMQMGRRQLYYHGIPVVEVPLNKYYKHGACRRFCLLTDKRNMVLALNTADLPENEVCLWYNPDAMENRQRSVFLAGTVVIDPQLISGFVIDVPEGE